MPDRSAAARELAETFKTIAHPDRIRLIEELGAGETDVSSLAESLGALPARVSQHLALLRAHHIVDERRDGRRHLYHLVRPALAAWIVEGLSFVETRADRLNAAQIEAVRRLWAPPHDLTKKG